MSVTPQARRDTARDKGCLYLGAWRSFRDLTFTFTCAGGRRCIEFRRGRVLTDAVTAAFCSHNDLSAAAADESSAAGLPPLSGPGVADRRDGGGADAPRRPVGCEHVCCEHGPQREGLICVRPSVAQSSVCFVPVGQCGWSAHKCHMRWTDSHGGWRSLEGRLRVRTGRSPGTGSCARDTQRPGS